MPICDHGAQVTVLSPHDGKSLRMQRAVLRWSVVVDGNSGAVADGDVLGEAHKSVIWRRRRGKEFARPQVVRWRGVAGDRIYRRRMRKRHCDGGDAAGQATPATIV